jgi:hypothetical protein
MSSTSRKRVAAACLAAAGLLGVCREASAQSVNCIDVGGQGAKRVYLTGSTAAGPFVNTLGKALAAANPPIYLIYQQGKGSCDGVAAMLTPPAAADISGTAQYYSGIADGGAPPTCTITGGDISAFDVGFSDVWQDSCAAFKDVHALPDGITDFQGPAQVMTFIVPAASSQTVISGQAAYLVFGFGDASQAPPWTDHLLMFQRTPASGTQSMIANAIKVPPDKWKGTPAPPAQKSGDVLANVLAQNANATNAEKTIGILASDLADANRKSGPTTGLTILAYQHFGQTCGYLPDSSSGKFDKINVREGRYAIWGPIHMLTKTAAGVPTNADVKTVMDYLTEKVDPPQSVLDAEIAAHTVPQCAMKVKRTAETGTPASFSPDKPCGCYFEFKNGSTPACAQCNETTPCATGVCRHGYCEAK